MRTTSRRVKLAVYVSPSEKIELFHAAQQEYVSLSDIVRQYAMNWLRATRQGTVQLSITPTSQKPFSLVEPDDDTSNGSSS